MIKEELANIYENLFNPIEVKHIGRWFKPVANAEELVIYATNHEKDNNYYKNWIELYTSVNDTSIGTLRTIFLDFDLTKKEYLKKELSENIISDILENGSEDVNKNVLTAIRKYDKENHSINSFIDVLTEEEVNKLASYVEGIEEEKLANLTEEEIKSYYFNKIEEGYLREPFKEATTVAKYFNSLGVETVLNWSGSKGLHLRIPLNKLSFQEKRINEDPKIFLNSLAESIETSVLNKPIKTSTIDYNVLSRNRGLQRIPCSKHEKSRLFSNFINPSYDYLTAVDQLEKNVPEYLPSIVNKEENTKRFLELPLVKESIATATTKKATDNYEEEGANPNYNFNSNNKELKEIIAKIYVKGQRNEIGYRLIHLLRRTGYSKAEVEDIFKDLHGSNSKSYAETIAGSISSAYGKDISKLGGLKHLIKGIEELASNDVKKEVIAYFKKNFNYYDKPTETKLNDKVTIGKIEHNILLYRTKAKEWYVLENFQGLEDYNLEIYRSLNYILLKTKDGKPIAKLKLKKSNDGLEATEKNLKYFKKKVEREVKGFTLAEDFIEEIDLFFSTSAEIETTENKLKTEKEEEDVFTKLIKNPVNKGALMELSHIIEAEAEINVVYNENSKTKEHYIFNNGYYEKLQEAKLQRYIEDKYSLRLPEESIKLIKGAIAPNNTYNNNYFQFKDNIFFNGITGTFEAKEKGFLTDKKVGSYVDGKYKLARRLTEEELAEDTKENGYSDLETLVYTIMSVPNDKEESVRRYKGFLEWLGYCFRPVNTNKKIINLVGDGDDGKSTLLDIVYKVFNPYAIVILPTELNKDFTEAVIGNNHLIVFDEASTEDIIPHENYIKNASNGRSNRSSRAIYSSETIANLKFGLMFILSNGVIKFNSSDEAFMERDDIIFMKRRFKQNPDKSKGQLKAKDVDSIIENDFRGFERIVNLGIIQYNKIRSKKTFELSTTITETQEIILDNDILKRFLAIKTRYDKTATTSNETLALSFLKWAEAEGIDLKEHFNYKNENSLKRKLKIELGSKVKEHYRNIKEEDLIGLDESRRKVYSIRLLTNTEVIERSSTKYCINEEESVVANAKYITGNEKLVYDLVDNLGIASITDLVAESDVPEVELIKTLTQLENWNYIEEYVE